MSDEIEWPDGELPQQPPKWDLIEATRVFDPETAQAGKRSQIAIYRLPKFVLWGQEALAKSMLRGGKDAAATCALELGLSRLRQFPGVAEICAARARVLKNPDPETMDWFDSFGTIDLDTGGAGALDSPYKRHIPEALAKQLSQLANELGMPTSQLAGLVLTAAQLGATKYVKAVYQKCIVATLRRFRERLERRAERAREYAEAVSVEPEPDGSEFSIDDVLGRRRRRKPPNLGRR